MSSNTKPQYNITDLFTEKKLVKTCAPMVRYSKLQFRNLVKKYDCDLLFTPMILADSFCQSSKARNNEFTTNQLDTPLIVQFAANTSTDFVQATRLVSPYCDGVDLNCGCPQRWAKEKNLGCELLKNPQYIYDIVKATRNSVDKHFSVSVKIRLKKNLKDTVEICRNLEKCGVTFLTVHARTPEENTGDINVDALKLIRDSISIPLIANGGLNSLTDCYELQELTRCQGVMIANSILTNPTLYSGQQVTTLDCVQEWVDICFNSTVPFDLYDKICNESSSVKSTIRERPFNLTFQCFHHHLVFMLEKILPRSKRRVFNNLKTFSDVLEFLEINLYVKPRLFSREQFNQSSLIAIDYSDRDIFESCDNYQSDTVNNSYKQSNSDGKYFSNKLNNSDSEDDYELFNIFT